MLYESTKRGTGIHFLHRTRNHSNGSGMGTNSIPGATVNKMLPISITYHTNDQVGLSVSQGMRARVAIHQRYKGDKEKVRELTHMKGRHCSLTPLPL